MIWMSLVGCVQEIPVSDNKSTAHPSPTLTITSITISQPAITPSLTSTPAALSPQVITLTEIPPQPRIILPTSTPKPLATPISLSLPEWITEVSANILLLGSTITRTISIFNIDSQQRYDIPVQVSELSPRWQWREDGHWLIYEEPSRVIKMIDIETGEVAKLADATRIIVSPDGRYAARINTRINEQGNRERFVTIEDREMEIESELVNPFLNLQFRNEAFIESAWTAHWSPDGAYLSVLYDKQYYSDNYDRNLAIYTPAGEIFRQYVDMDTSWENPWSPVGPYKILYTDGWTPCILEVIEDRRNCLETIDEWLTSQNLSSFHFIWSPDGNKISFVYNNTDDIADIPKTGICYIELTTDKIECPISADDLWLDKQLFARIQFWSPDGKYLALFFDNLGFWDIVGPVRVAVINAYEESFWLLEEEYSWPFSNPWRPPIVFENAE
jgi:hypothetical protein